MDSRTLVAPSLWLLLLAAVASFIHCVAPAIVDQDTSYHIAVARLMLRHGMLHAFPWTSFSWLAEHYVDKELLFHTLMLPVADLPPVYCARIVGASLGTLLLTTLFCILRAERVRLPALWVLLGLLSSGAFVLRFAMVRPHLLSVTAALCFVWLAARRFDRWLLLLALIYPFCYTAWHLPLILLAIVEFARLCCERRVAPRTLLCGVLGLALGIAVHPHFPANLEFFWVQNVEVLRIALGQRAGFEMGGEFRSYGLADALRQLLIPLALLTAALVRGALRIARRQATAVEIAFALCALAFTALTLSSSRFIEYQAPFALAAAALNFGPHPRSWQWLPAALAACGAYFAWASREPLRNLTQRRDDFPPPAMAALRDAIPEHSQIITCDWGLTGGLMLALPERRFVVALDPVFFFYQDPTLYRFWFDAVQQPPPHPATAFRERMSGDFIVCDARTKWRPLVSALLHDPAAKLARATPLWIAFDIRSPTPTPR